MPTLTHPLQDPSSPLTSPAGDHNQQMAHKVSPEGSVNKLDVDLRSPDVLTEKMNAQNGLSADKRENGSPTSLSSSSCIVTTSSEQRKSSNSSAAASPTTCQENHPREAATPTDVPSLEIECKEIHSSNSSTSTVKSKPKASQRGDSTDALISDEDSAPVDEIGSAT